MSKRYRCTFQYKYGEYCNLGNSEIHPTKCKPDICPFAIIRRIFENSTGMYMAKDMTGI